MKLLKDNLGKTLSDISLSNVFLGLSYMETKIKAKPNKLELIKLIIFCTEKETLNKRGRNAMKWEKIVSNTVDKCLISKTYK